ncbi:hypothetical protein ACHAWC_002355 [Mediolabrus comicus]
MEELDNIIADSASSIVKRSRAQVELAQLQKRFGQNKVRPSVRALMNHDRASGGVVTRNAAVAEVRIKREEQRIAHEKEIEQIKMELQQLHENDVKRKKLEKRLSAVEVEVAAIELLEEREAEEAAVALLTSSDAPDAPDATQEKSPSKRELLSSPDRTRESAIDLLPISPVTEGVEDEDEDEDATSTPVASPIKKNVEDASAAILVQETWEGGDIDVNERIKQLEAQLKEWKGIVEELTLQCDELKEENMMQEKEIKALRERSPPPSGRPSLASQRGTSRRFSTRASVSSNYSTRFSTISRQSSNGLSLEKQMREEAELEVKALEERLAEIDGEKGELIKELEAMKSILANTSDDDSVGKKTVERLVYQLSCRKCNKHGSWIGTTHDDIKETIDGHICRVVEEYADGKGKSKSSPSKGSTNSSGKIENWSKPFAEHFARHCKPKIGFKSVTEKEIRKFCRANIKIEVLRRQDGTDLMWECEEE